MLSVDALCINQQDISERNDQLKKNVQNLFKGIVRPHLAWGRIKDQRTSPFHVRAHIHEPQIARIFRGRSSAPRPRQRPCRLFYAAGVGDERSVRSSQDVLDATEALLSTLFGGHESLIRIKAVEDLFKRP